MSANLVRSCLFVDVLFLNVDFGVVFASSGASMAANLLLIITGLYRIASCNALLISSVALDFFFSLAGIHSYSFMRLEATSVSAC